MAFGSQLNALNSSTNIYINARLVNTICHRRSSTFVEQAAHTSTFFVQGSHLFFSPTSPLPRFARKIASCCITTLHFRYTLIRYKYSAFLYTSRKPTLSVYLQKFGIIFTVNTIILHLPFTTPIIESEQNSRTPFSHRILIVDNVSKWIRAHQNWSPNRRLFRQNLGIHSIHYFWSSQENLIRYGHLRPHIYITLWNQLRNKRPKDWLLYGFWPRCWIDWYIPTTHHHHQDIIISSVVIRPPWS